MDKVSETLLTVLALSQEGYKGPLSHAIPARLSYSLKKAKKLGLVEVDDSGAYLSEEGAAAIDQEFGSSPFCG